MIKIPDQHYIGFQKRGDVFLGFMTPDGTDKAAEKRKNTVDNWCTEYDWNLGQRSVKPKEKPQQTLKNELLEGFTLAREVRRSGWNGGNVVWRIEDPRGFELEISSANLASIMNCTTIINGVIQGKCIWGREGAHNILLPEGSEPYQEAVKATKLIKTSVSLKDVKVGDKVELQNGTIGFFLGVYRVLVKDYGDTVNQTYARNFGKTYVSNWRTVLDRYIIETDLDTFEVVSTPKVSKILKAIDNPLSKADIAKRINDLNSVGKAKFLMNNYRGIALVSHEKINLDDLKVVFEQRPISELLIGNELRKNVKRNYESPLYVYRIDDSYHIFYNPTKHKFHGGSEKTKQNEASYQKLNDSCFDDLELRLEYRVEVRNNSWYYGHNNFNYTCYDDHKNILLSELKDENFFKVMLEYKGQIIDTLTYNGR